MLCNLFSCFDPYVYLFFLKNVPLKWMVFIMLIFFINWQYYFFSVSNVMVLKSLVGTVWSSFDSLIKELSKSFLILFTLILSIFLVNLMGLIPFVFTVSSHMSVNLSFSLSLWMGGVFVSLMKSVDGFFSHMVPTGTPTVLWIFLVMVETVSVLIRPFTLSIRLMANVMAGHLVMNLFGSFIVTEFSYFFLLAFQGMFLIFECCISLVQSYVFVSLLSLYWDES